MPSVGPKSYCSFKETQSSEAEIVHEESRGLYVGAAIVALIILGVLGAPAWQLASWLAQVVGGPVGRAIEIAVLLAAAVLCCFVWLGFGRHLRYEIRVSPRERSFVLIRHSLFGKSREIASASRNVLEIELLKSQQRGMDFFELAVNLEGEDFIRIDGCTSLGELQPLAEALSKSLGVPLVQRDAKG